MKEEWRYFKGYKVSNHGRVILKSGKITTGWNRGGYKGVSLSGVKYYVHRIVAELFCEGWFCGAQVDHIDRDPTNNNSCNLRWVTQSENCRNQGERKKLPKISDVVVTAMVTLKHEYGLNNTEIAGVLNIDRRSVSRILVGRSRKDLTGL